MISTTTYPSSGYARWWIKKGPRGRLAVVNYRPFPGEEIGHGYKYHEDAFRELQRVEHRRNVRRSTLHVLGGLFILAAIGLQWGCAGLHADLSAGPQIDPIVGGDSNWLGSGPVFELAIRKETGPWFCQYAHTSNLGSGWPVNGDQETTLDRVTCGRSFALYR